MGTPPAQGALRTLKSEAGVTLIEMVISATILVIIALAVMATLDTASSSTAANRGRTVASALAEQDQERMRGMSAVELSNYHPDPGHDNVGRVEYTVESRSEWVRDSTGGAETCTANTKQADYMRITSTVTSNVVGKRIKPVVDPQPRRPARRLVRRQPGHARGLDQGRRRRAPGRHAGEHHAAPTR